VSICPFSQNPTEAPGEEYAKIQDAVTGIQLIKLNFVLVTLMTSSNVNTVYVLRYRFI